MNVKNESNQMDNNGNNTSREFYPSITTFFIEEPKDSYFQALFSNNVTSTGGSLLGGVNALYTHMKALSKCFSSERYRISKFRQFCVLIRMMMLRIARARIALIIQCLHHILCGLCFGLIFLKVGNKGERMFDHLKFCVGAILMIVYTQVMVPILSYPSEVKIVKKETFNRWYSLVPYYAALTLSRIPLQIFLNMIFLSISYWMTGLPAQCWRFGLFSLIGLTISFVAEGMGLAIGATFSVTNGSAVGPLLTAPLIGLAIYGFDFATQIPNAMNIFMNISFMRIGVVSMVLAVFGYGRPNLDCDDVYCHFSDPKVLLKFLDIDKISMLHQFFLLSLLLVFFRVLLFLSLRKRCGT